MWFSVPRGLQSKSTHVGKHLVPNWWQIICYIKKQNVFVCISGCETEPKRLTLNNKFVLRGFPRELSQGLINEMMCKCCTFWFGRCSGKIYSYFVFPLSNPYTGNVAKPFEEVAHSLKPLLFTWKSTFLRWLFLKPADISPFCSIRYLKDLRHQI